MVDMRFKSDSGSNSDSDHTNQLVTAATDSSTRIGSKYRICNMIFALLVFLLTGTVILMSWEKKQLVEQFAMRPPDNTTTLSGFRVNCERREMIEFPSTFWNEQLARE